MQYYSRPLTSGIISAFEELTLLVDKKNRFVKLKDPDNAF